MQWLFRQQEPGEITRDPIIGEFFSTDAIDNPAEALVREGIQNALDAKRDEQIRVRLLLVPEQDAPPSKITNRWFDGAWDHLHASGNGLKEAPDKKDACSFLVFEDFGTTGLQGDVVQAFDLPGNKNSFFYFFRAEGRSGKSESDRGRWGIGKHVFPRASRISTCFGLTVRADDRKQYLMGHCILKSHYWKTKPFSPDGYLGEPVSKGSLMLPVSDRKILAQFCNDFHVTRDSQPGLSIVVPFVDTEITFEHLREAVISDYFYPILKGELVVDVETPDQQVRIDSASLLKETGNLEASAREKLLPIIALAHWAITESTGQGYTLDPCVTDCPAWTEDLFPPNLIRKMRTDLDNGKNLAVHMGIKVREKKQQPVMSYFNAYLCQDGFESGRPLFIREGIIISDVRATKTRGVRSLVIIEDRPLATLLGDAENPAHTQWQKDSSNFKNKYPYGKNYIEFVTKSVANIVNTLSVQDKQKDPYLLADIFALPVEKPEEQPEKSVTGQKVKSGTRSGKGTIKVTPRQTLYRISQIPGGFRISPGETKIASPLKLKIEVAYHIRRGNSTSKYHPSDFQLDHSPVRFQDSLQGVSVIGVRNNRMVVNITDPDFQMQVTGFDEKRDLVVNLGGED